MGWKCKRVSIEFYVNCKDCYLPHVMIGLKIFHLALNRIAPNPLSLVDLRNQFVVNLGIKIKLFNISTGYCCRTISRCRW